VAHLRLLTLSVLVVALLPAWLPSLAARAAAARWTLAALVPPGAVPVRRGTPLWIELRNESGAARLVCLQRAIVALKSPDVAYAYARPIDGSSCTALTDFVVVRPGHALSSVIYVKSRRGVLRGESEPLIDLTFVERDIADPLSVMQQASVRWVGTIDDARRAGISLLGGAAPVGSR
jgi:hypothetical protein